MQRQADTFISSNEREFILQAIHSELRIDGRKPLEHRPLTFSFAPDSSAATVALGGTRALAVVAAALDAPHADRPNEGTLRFDVELSPMASPAFEAGRPGGDAVELARLVERTLRGSGAIDQEALCVLAGRRVWHLRVIVHVLDHCGNLTDACCLAALAALRVFRTPHVTVSGEGDVTVHPPEVHEPSPLTLHHLPFSFTFGVFEGGNVLALDPSLSEEAAMEGSFSLAVNPQQELCGAQKADGLGLEYGQLMRAVRLAASSVEEVAAALKGALDAHHVAVVAARVRRRRGAGAAAAAAGEPGRRVAVVVGDGGGEGRINSILAGMREAVDASPMETDEGGTSDGSAGSEGISGGGEGSERGDHGGSGREGGRAQPRPAAAQASAGPRAPPAGPRLVGGGAPKRGPPSGGSGGEVAARAKPKKRVGKGARPQGPDALDAIAAIIAGGRPGEAPVVDLTAAIKHPGSSGKAPKGAVK